jgi:acetyl esterase/lipase
MNTFRILAITLGCAAAGCSLATRIGVQFLYQKADLPSSQILRDLCYASSPCDGPDQLLDWYLPTTRPWPVIVFVHGGGWDSGNKNLRAGGADVYANIGRYYAGRGIGVAVINYRLQPRVKWAEQADDVRTAVAWVRSRALAYGGQPDRVFLMGHSAGAHLASWVALTAAPELRNAVRGVIAVSGAGLDLADEQTYQLGADRRYYATRFQNGDASDDWKRRASPARFVNPQAPPFLILYATGETRALQHQSQLLHAALEKNGVSSRLVPVPGESHTRIVLALSRSGKVPSGEILQFVH